MKKKAKKPTSLKPIKKLSKKVLRRSKVGTKKPLKSQKRISKKPSKVFRKPFPKSKKPVKKAIKRKPVRKPIERKRKPTGKGIRAKRETRVERKRKPVRKPVRKPIRPVRRKPAPPRKPKPTKKKPAPKKKKPLKPPAKPTTEKEEIVYEEGEAIGTAERERFFYDIRTQGAKINIKPEEGGGETYLDASFGLVEKEEDLTEDGFVQTWEDLLFGISKGRTSGSENARVQILIDPSLPIDTEVRRSKYDFSKKGGMMTGWYKPDEWKHCSEAGIGIVRKIATYGWDIKTVRINVTYQKPSKSKRMVLATLRRK